MWTFRDYRYFVTRFCSRLWSRLQNINKRCWREERKDGDGYWAIWTIAFLNGGSMAWVSAKWSPAGYSLNAHLVAGLTPIRGQRLIFLSTDRAGNERYASTSPFAVRGVKIRWGIARWPGDIFAVLRDSSWSSSEFANGISGLSFARPSVRMGHRYSAIGSSPMKHHAFQPTCRGKSLMPRRVIWNHDKSDIIIAAHGRLTSRRSIDNHIEVIRRSMNHPRW